MDHSVITFTELEWAADCRLMEKKSEAVWKMYWHIYCPALRPAQWSLRQVREWHRPSSFMSKLSWTPEVSLEQDCSFDWVKGRAPSRASENVQHQMKYWQQLDAHQSQMRHRQRQKRRCKRIKAISNINVQLL